MSLLSVRDLSLSASESSLVGPLSFELKAGEKLGIIGESGSGKSLTALSIIGLLPSGIAAAGEITVADHQIVGARDAAIRPLRGKTMSMVFQEPMSALDPLMRISAQLTHAGARDIVAALEEVDLDADLASRFPHQLSGGQRQRVLLAMAMAGSPDVLICDEPTTALDATTQDGVLRAIERVTKQHGTALLFISHDLNVIQRMCPRVLVMRDGHIVEEGLTARVLMQPRHAYTRKLVSASQPPNFALTPASGEKDMVLLEGISKQHGSQVALTGIDLRVRRGERLGIVGGSGSGKTSLLKIVAGLDAPTSGTSVVDGRVQMVFQDPQGSLNPRLKIWKSIAEAMPGRPSKTEQRKRAAAALGEVGIPGTALDRYPHEFSGGQRQRISIARALCGEPDILLADEAVSALDMSVQAQVLELLARLIEDRGLTLLFVTHNLAVVHGLCDRVAVLNRGELVEHGPTERVWSAPTSNYTRKLIAAAGQ
ncbi:ATP-binding cassette domain-containing protein [Corynebacterium macginleyi]|uniref:ATP-binding cassette domain-containing protein n=1 Tax=Corynebacterium macginleyi TaxID=38290 RepID=UPI000EF9D9C7|nr:ABC transporter ATP-binding protein [Corynebacterium macginleyi]QRJ58454.1 ABC transporter ATP-binding protein [Corynebacterium macginleyi]QRP21917.1 ABC transporter ATP-binding protein [Corynebacterium macginleyi]RMB67248.1 ABC transporter ATP-binding protein [Corynebacterium macginleyi]RMB68950.1 ABC transporter ATP-binding protein [Corynebacterium macginleyi]